MVVFPRREATGGSTDFPGRGCRSPAEQLAEPRPEAGVKKVVKNRVDAAVGAAHPLGDGHHNHPEGGLFLSHVRRQLEARECRVEWQPREGEDGHDDCEHSKSSYLCLVQIVATSVALIFSGQLRRSRAASATRNLPAPDSSAYHCVT